VKKATIWRKRVGMSRYDYACTGADMFEGRVLMPELAGNGSVANGT
jgi:hypothetical protein